MTRGPFKQRHYRGEDGEEGQALILAVVFLVIFSLLLTALLSGVGVNLSQTAVANDQGQLQYAADAAIEWGINQLGQSGNACNSGNKISGTPFYPVLGNPGKTDGSTPFQITNPTAHNGSIATTVYCEPMTGLGSGAFGGYSVVTGMNYPNTPGYPSFTSGYGSQEYAGTQTCTSLSGDPIESGASTYASQVTLGSGTQTSASPPVCVSYPTSASGPSVVWTDTNFSPDAGGSPVIPGDLNKAVAVDPSDIYAVGLPAATTVSGPGSTLNNNATITSAALFTGTASYIGKSIIDSDGAFAQNTKITGENNANHTATIGPKPTTTDSSDTFSVAASTSGGIYHFSGEDDFSYIGAGTAPTTLNGVWSPTSDPNHVWVVGNSGTILACSGAGCTSETATWSGQTSGTTQNLNSVTGNSTAALWAVGDGGTLLSSTDGLTWSGGKLTASGSTTNASKSIASSFFTAAATHKTWIITDSAGAIPAGTTITGEGNGTATLSNAATASAGTDTFSFTITESGAGLTTNTSKTIISSVFTVAAAHKTWIITDSAGAIKAGTTITAEGNGTATLNNAATATVGTDTFTLTNPTAPNFTSVYSDSSGNVWATATAGNGGLIAECANCSASPSAWTVVSGAPTNVKYSGIAAAGGSVWAIGGTTIAACAATCGTSAWSTIAQAGDTLNDIVAADSTDIWVVGSNAANPIILSCQGSCTAAGSTWKSQTANDVEKALNTVTAVPANLRLDPSSWGGSVWAAGIIPTGNAAAGQTLGTGWVTYSPASTGGSVLLELKGGNVLNGGALNAVTPMKVDSGNFVQFFTAGGACPAQPANLQIAGGTYQCAVAATDPLVTPLKSVDEPLPSECSSAATCSAGGISASTGIANCVLSTCIDQSATGVTINPPAPYSATCPSFKEYFPGYYSKVPTINAQGGTTYFASGLYYFAGGGSGALGNDTNPGYVIGGQPGSGDVPTVVTTSPCWRYISDNWQSLDSRASSVSGSWYEGGGSTTSPNGTGVSWLFGSKTWFDIHTLNLELFTREVPDYTSAGPTAPQTLSQEKNEGTNGVTIREVPPQCPSGVPASSGFTDGAVHPGPYCVTIGSKWIPLNPGLKNQALQIDANNHSPFVYIHGSIYMPDNDMTLFTNQPLRDVWVGALDVNSLELTFDSQSSPPIQIIGGGSPQVAKVELISQAQDPISNTTVWEEAVVNEPLFGAALTGIQANKPASITQGSTTIASILFGPSVSYIGFTITGNGIPPNTTITSQNTQGTAQMSNAATVTNAHATVTLTPIPSIQSWRYCNGGGSPSPTAFIQACQK